MSVSDCWVEGEWFVDFRRSLSVSEFKNWGKLLNHLQQVSLDPNTNDSVI